MAPLGADLLVDGCAALAGGEDATDISVSLVGLGEQHQVGRVAGWCGSGGSGCGSAVVGDRGATSGRGKAKPRVRSSNILSGPSFTLQVMQEGIDWQQVSSVGFEVLRASESSEFWGGSVAFRSTGAYGYAGSRL